MNNPLFNRLHAYSQLMRLNKPIGIFLLLWPTLIALWLASEGSPPVKELLIFMLGVLLMRSAGCAVNDFADKDFDAHVKRTQNRPLAQKVIKPWEAVTVFLVVALVCLFLVFQLNLKTQLLAVVALILTVIYPFSKRWFSMPQVILGAAFGMAIPMAFMAIQNRLSWVCLGLFISMLLWTTAFDTQYAMVDKEDDVHLPIQSTAILFNSYEVAITMGLYGLSLGLFTWLSYHLSLGLPVYLGIGGAMLIASYQYTLIKTREPEKCFKAFLSNHYFGASLFLGVVFSYLLK